MQKIKDAREAGRLQRLRLWYPFVRVSDDNIRLRLMYPSFAWIMREYSKGRGAQSPPLIPLRSRSWLLSRVFLAPALPDAADARVVSDYVGRFKRFFLSFYLRSSNTSLHLFHSSLYLSRSFFSLKQSNLNLFVNNWNQKGEWTDTHSANSILRDENIHCREKNDRILLRSFKERQNARQIIKMMDISEV